MQLKNKQLNLNQSEQSKNISTNQNRETKKKKTRVIISQRKIIPRQIFKATTRTFANEKRALQLVFTKEVLKTDYLTTQQEHRRIK